MTCWAYDLLGKTGGKANTCQYIMFYLPHYPLVIFPFKFYLDIIHSNYVIRIFSMGHGGLPTALGNLKLFTNGTLELLDGCLHFR